MQKFVLDRMIKDDLKRMASIGDHVNTQLVNYGVHDRLTRRYIRWGQYLLKRALKRVERM